MDKKKKNNARFGIIFALWVVLALVLFILFLINWTRISSNLKETGFFEKVFGTTPEFIENAPDPVETSSNIEKNEVGPGSEVSITIGGGNGTEGVSPASTTTGATSTNSTTTTDSTASTTLIEETEVAQSPEQEASLPQNTEQSVEQNTETIAQTQTPSETKQQEVTLPQTKPVENKPAATEQPAATTATMNLKLFFMDITSNGSIIRHEVTRKMPKSTTPLMDAMNALIAGPNSVESSVGCTTLVSNGTRLLGASVKSGTATLNFSSEFEYNQYGVEGLRGQIQQIVFTATAFPTVDNVQFLVDGKKKQYLGEEGVWIGTPLDRNSF